MDVNIVEQYLGKIITRDQRLVVSRQYKAGSTWPMTRHVQLCRYTQLQHVARSQLFQRARSPGSIYA
jgi:hypothetical protein